MAIILKTERLILRLLMPSDITYLDDLESDPEVKKYFPTGPRDHTKTEIMIKKFISFYEEKGLPCFLLFERESNDFIGRAGFGVTESGEIEVGYVLHKQFWNKGFASEALLALLQYAKENISAEYIIAFADTANVGSTRVMEKCGMTFYKTDMHKDVECRFFRIKNR